MKQIPPQYKIVIIVLFFSIGWLLFALAISIYNDYQTDVKITQFRVYNAKMAREEADKPKQFFYEKLRLTQEKWRKENLNEKNAGEKVIVIEPDNKAGKLFSYDDTLNVSPEPTPLEKMSNPERWWMFFFGDEISTN